MAGVGSTIGAVVGTIIAPGVGTTIGAAVGGAIDSATASKGKGGSTKAPEAPKPVETYETQQEAVRVRSQSEANRRRSSFSNTFVASRGMGTGGIGKSFLGQ